MILLFVINCSEASSKSAAAPMVPSGEKRPMDFASFPSVLLIATLLRLSLNVASTRIILVEGHAGGDAAGNVIASFFLCYCAELIPLQILCTCR